jgi:hypothetical protein
MPANSPLAYSPRGVSLGVGCLLSPLRYLRSSLFRYIRAIVTIVFASVLFLFYSPPTPLSLSLTAGRTTALWDLEEGGPTDADMGGNYNPVGMCIFMCTSFYVSVCVRRFFKPLCAFLQMNLGGLGTSRLTYPTQVKARPWPSSLNEPVNALNYHFPLSAFLCKKKTGEYVCVCARACACACVYLWKCACVHVCVHVCGTAYPYQIETHMHTLQCWTTQ